MLNDGRREPAIGCLCTARSDRAVSVSVREPEGPRERDDLRSDKTVGPGVALALDRTGTSPCRGTLPAATITSRRAVDNATSPVRLPQRYRRPPLLSDSAGGRRPHGPFPLRHAPQRASSRPGAAAVLGAGRQIPPAVARGAARTSAEHRLRRSPEYRSARPARSSSRSLGVGGEHEAGAREDSRNSSGAVTYQGAVCAAASRAMRASARSLVRPPLRGRPPRRQRAERRAPRRPSSRAQPDLSYWTSRGFVESGCCLLSSSYLCATGGCAQISPRAHARGRARGRPGRRRRGRPRTRRGNGSHALVREGADLQLGTSRRGRWRLVVAAAGHRAAAVHASQELWLGVVDLLRNHFPCAARKRLLAALATRAVELELPSAARSPRHTWCGRPHRWPRLPQEGIDVSSAPTLSGPPATVPLSGRWTFAGQPAAVLAPGRCTGAARPHPRTRRVAMRPVLYAYTAKVVEQFLRRHAEPVAPRRLRSRTPSRTCNFCPSWRHCDGGGRADGHISPMAMVRRSWRGLSRTPASPHVRARSSCRSERRSLWAAASATPPGRSARRRRRPGAPDAPHFGDASTDRLTPTDSRHPKLGPRMPASA
jgi:hypothetical protein